MTPAQHDVTTITACQGHPRCDLMGNAAIAAQQAGCPWCTRITIDEDGSERCQEPGNA